MGHIALVMIRTPGCLPLLRAGEPGDPMTAPGWPAGNRQGQAAASTPGLVSVGVTQTGNAATRPGVRSWNR
jgi:hypothetical protein